MKLRADRRVGLLLGGVLVLTFVAIGATVALPAADSSLDAKPREMSKAAERGMTVYKSEGCWYCHTGYIRNTSSDATLGDPLDAKAYAGRSPALLGVERIGPDLTSTAADVDALRAHGAAGSLAYLSEKDLEALIAYLAGE